MKQKQEAEEKRNIEEDKELLRDEQRQSRLCGEMVFVQGGRFRMGSVDVWNAKPVHEVELDDFYIGKYPVTQSQWKAVMGTNPSHFKGDLHPVENVSWEDAQEFISKLSSLTSKAFRLPTEAEWEYAARGGQKSRGYTYSGSDTLRDVAWYDSKAGLKMENELSTNERRSKKTHPVGRKKPNELGIYDMSGNVYEWCSDWYDRDYYERSPLRNPQGPTTGVMRIFRGGCFLSGQDDCCCASRISIIPCGGCDGMGFRLACYSG